MATANSSQYSVFQQARDSVYTEINQIVQCLLNKQEKLFGVINALESEFINTKILKQNEIRKYKNLKTYEVKQKSRSEDQQQIINNLDLKIRQMSHDNPGKSDYVINIGWGFDKKEFISKIQRSEIKKVPMKIRKNIPKSRPVLSKKENNLKNKKAVKDENEITYSVVTQREPFRSAIHGNTFQCILESSISRKEKHKTNLSVATEHSVEQLNENWDETSNESCDEDLVDFWESKRDRKSVQDRGRDRDRARDGGWVLGWTRARHKSCVWRRDRFRGRVWDVIDF